MSLHGRLAVVTGGASGIGKATCLVLAARGASVVVADLNIRAAQIVASQLPDTASHRGAFLDVGDAGSVDKLFADIRDNESLPVSILVNSAGVAKRSSFVNTTEEEFDQIIRVNLKGTFLATRAAARSMIASGVTNGVIVNISSISGKIGLCGLAAYGASKGGVESLTKTVAHELAQHGIRCNVVVPSLARTPMADVLPEETQKSLTARTPMGRLCEPDEVAEAVLFLCCPNSSFVTGAALEVTGGLGT